MATYRYKGSEPVDVPVLGRVVKPKDRVEIPDALVNVTGDADAGGFVWPEELWEPLTPAKRGGEKANKPATETDGD